jgi:hypothetical protein
MHRPEPQYHFLVKISFRLNHQLFGGRRSRPRLNFYVYRPRHPVWHAIAVGGAPSRHDHAKEIIAISEHERWIAV